MMRAWVSAAILSTAMMTAPFVHGQSGAPIHTCSQYDDCVTTTVTKVTPQCGDIECSFKVCYTLSGGGACDKGSSETFSLACDNGVGDDPLEQCNQDSIFDTWDTIGEGISGFAACQYVEAGGYAYFASKDYPECSDSFVDTLSIDGISGNSSVNYSCGPSDDLGVAGHICSTWGMRECIFTVGPMPECEIEGSSTMDPSEASSTMNPSDVSSFALPEIASTKASAVPSMLTSIIVSSDITGGDSDSPSTVPSMMVFTSTDVPTVSQTQEEVTVLPSFLPVPTLLPTVGEMDTSSPSAGTTILPSTGATLALTMDLSADLTQEASQEPMMEESLAFRDQTTVEPSISGTSEGFDSAPTSLPTFLPVPTSLPTFLPVPTLVPTLDNTDTIDPSTGTTMLSSTGVTLEPSNSGSYTDGPSMIVSNDGTSTEVPTAAETEEELTILPTFLEGSTMLPTVKSFRNNDSPSGTTILASSEKTVAPSIDSSQLSTDASLMPTLQSSFGDSTEQPTGLTNDTPTIEEAIAPSPTPIKDAEVSPRDQPAATMLPTVMSVGDSSTVNAILTTSDAMMHRNALVYSTRYLSLMVAILVVLV